MSGTYTGNLDRLTVKGYVVDAGPVRPGLYPEWYADATVEIDGDLYVSQELHIVPVGGVTSSNRLLEFSIKNIGMLSEAENVTHELSVRLNTSTYLDGDEFLWMMDASDAPSGVQFHPSTLARTVVDAARPDEEE